MDDPLLMLPGPTSVPEAVLAAASHPQINHRGAQFAELTGRIRERLRRVFLTESEVALLNSSGTGAMEAVVVNTLSPGDRVLCCTGGWFGDRFGAIARCYGLEVEELRVEWGQPIDPGALAERLSRDPEVRAVLVTSNESSTGVRNDLEALSRARGDHPALLLVDAVSDLGAAELRTDEWGLDAVVSASQKALSAPPGVSFLALSRRALEALGRARLPRYYFDLRRILEFHARGQCPFTPCLPVFFALDVALERLLEEGLPRVWERHQQAGRAMRAGAAALGLELFAAPEAASPTITALRVPAGVGALHFQQRLWADHRLAVSGGMKHTAEEVVRVGHLGAGSSRRAVLATLAAMEQVLADLGRKVRPGAAVTAAQQIYAEAQPALPLSG